MSPSDKRFLIALSFPGERREVVAPVAAILASKFGRERILYDMFHEGEFARIDLDVYLPQLYREKSELIVLFLCTEYAKKRWCKLEWRFVRDLIQTADQNRIMFLSFTDIGANPDLGIMSGDGYARIDGRTPEQIADLIIDRLRFNCGSIVDEEPLKDGEGPTPAPEKPRRPKHCPEPKPCNLASRDLAFFKEDIESGTFTPVLGPGCLHLAEIRKIGMGQVAMATAVE